MIVVALVILASVIVFAGVIAQILRYATDEKASVQQAGVFKRPFVGFTALAILGIKISETVVMAGQGALAAIIFVAIIALYFFAKEMRPYSILSLERVRILANEIFNPKGILDWFFWIFVMGAGISFVIIQEITGWPDFNFGGARIEIVGLIGMAMTAFIALGVGITQLDAYRISRSTDGFSPSLYFSIVLNSIMWFTYGLVEGIPYLYVHPFAVLVSGIVLAAIYMGSYYGKQGWLRFIIDALPIGVFVMIVKLTRELLGAKSSKAEAA